MNKILTEKLEDQFKGRLPGFVTTSGKVMSKAEASPEQSDRLPDRTIRPASDIEVVNRLDLDPKSGDCLQDLTDNLGTYLGLGAFFAWTFAPVYGPVQRAMGSVINRALSPIKSAKALAQASKGAASVLKSTELTAVMKGFPGAVGRWFVGAGKWMVGDWTKTVEAWRSGSGLTKTKSIFPATWGAVKTVKRVFLVALAAKIVYDNVYVKAVQPSLKDVDSEGFQIGLNAMEVGLQVMIKFDIIMEELMTKMDSDLDKECLWLNVITSTVILSYLGQGLRGISAGGRGPKTAEEAQQFIFAERASRIEKFGNDAKGLFLKAGVDGQKGDEYYKLYATKGAAAAGKFLNNETLHAKCVVRFEKLETKTINALKAEHASNAAKAKELTVGPRADNTRVLRNVKNTAEESAKRLAKDPRVNLPNPDGATVLVNPANIVSVPGEIALLGQNFVKLEKALIKGEIGLDQAIRIHQSGFAKSFEAAAKIASSDAKSISDLSRSMQTLTSNEKLLNAVVGRLEPVTANWAQKLVGTRDARQLAALNKSKEGLEAVKKAKDLVSLELQGAAVAGTEVQKSVEIAMKAIKKASNIEAPVGMGAAKTLAYESLMIGTTVALVTTVARSILAKSLDDVEVWQNKNLARQLALNTPLLGWYNATGSEKKNLAEKYQSSLEAIMKRTLDPGVSRRLFENYIFKFNNKFIKTFFTRKNNKKEVRIGKTLEAFMRLKTENINFAAAFEEIFRADLQGFGPRSFTPTVKAREYREKWHPIIINILIANSGLTTKITQHVINNDQFWEADETERVKIINSKVFAWDNEIEENLELFRQDFRDSKKKNKDTVKEIKKENQIVNKDKLTKIVQEMLSESRGKGYTPYPYHSHIGQDDEPAEDFMEDWKDFELSLTRDESRNTAIEVAKILIKDLELFGDVIDLVGQNQSVATEILKAFRKNDVKQEA